MIESIQIQDEASCFELCQSLQNSTSLRLVSMLLRGNVYVHTENRVDHLNQQVSTQ